MRRIAILFVSLIAALPAFSQAPAPAKAPAGAAAPSGAAAPAVTGPHPKTPAENDAIVALFKDTDPDKQIKDAEDLLTTYPDTDYKAQVLLMEAQAYNSKRDYPKAIVAGEKSLAADPSSFETLLMLADIYSRTAKPTDLDLNDNLTRAEKYANEALADIDKAQKPKADLPDEQWAQIKTGGQAQAYLALGFTAVLRKKYDEAKTDFNKSLTMNPDPLTMLYIGRSYAAAKQYDDAIASDEKAAALPNVPDQIKKYADSDKTRFLALKKQQSQ
jgi:tetratricopeptide (TPR) repeat protein